MDISSFADWIQNISDRKKQLATAALSVLAGSFVLIGYFQSGPNALRYAEAEAAFAKWSASPENEQLYALLKEAIYVVPELQKKYEAIIAQKLLGLNRIDEALVLATRALHRVEQEVPFHADFAKTTLLIEQGSFQEALEHAVALKEQMGPSFLQEQKGGSLLYIHNLLRIACLQQELKNPHGEKAAWEELEAFLQTKNKQGEILLAGFTEQKINLTEYITERKKSLYANSES